MSYEIIKFQNDNVELEVSVSPEEETVWLSKTQMSTLFNRDRTVISRHINNIYKEGELDKKSTCAKNAHIPEKRTRLYETELYNLDVVISVGYRIKSRNGVLFRKWALSVLKEYLLKGYVINNIRTLITPENYLNLIRRVDLLESTLSEIVKEQKHLMIENIIIFENEPLTAIIAINRIIESARKSILLIDPYVDIRTLNVFKFKNKEVPLEIVTSTKSILSQIDIKAYIDECGELIIKRDDRYHDRYLIIDNEVFYHVGGSINYLGKKMTQIEMIKDNEIIMVLKNRIYD